jgi:hypothetical protein
MILLVARCRLANSKTMSWILSPSGTLIACAITWFVSAYVITVLAEVNLVQRINFATINAIFALLILQLVLK